GALFLFIVVATSMNIMVLQNEKRQQSRVGQVYEPLLESLMSMDSSIGSMLAASRGYTLTQKTEFLAQYDEAIRNFQTTANAAFALATQPRDRELVQGMYDHFVELRKLSDQQIELSDPGGNYSQAIERMLEAARIRRSAYDFAGAYTQKERVNRAAMREQLDNLRVAQTLLLVVVSLTILFLAGFLVLRIERNLDAQVAKQVRKTEAMIAGMADGVMLVEGDGRVAFINPAGVSLLGNRSVGTPMEEQAQTYGLRSLDGKLLDTREIPAAQALSTGKPVRDATIAIDYGEGKAITVSMNAVPIKEEDGRVTGVVVSFRDVTERRRLEEAMQVQAERAQILADAGAFFASNIDPDWVNQAIAERVAEVLGDWAAVILKNPGTNDLRVSSLYHRDMASLGLAWAFVYRQPLMVGEGIFGQVVSSGYPSLITNLEPGATSEAPTTYHVSPMKIASLLILPLTTRREILGALIIAANDPERQMNEQKLPLAELLAERAALAIENARLYTEQVEARRKLEDLSRLKDEFLSIASHELRTPVTSIKGYTQLAKTLIQENELGTSVEYLDVALDQIDRMSRLILELLDVSRIETGRLEIKREPIHWRNFVRRVVDWYRTAHTERDIDLVLPEDDTEVEGDRDRLEQVLGNLLENAIKYSPDGSGVRVIVRRDQDKVLTVVSDSGIGIPADELSQVFERFHRGRQVSSTNYGGLGLGLYISKQIVERHGGNIWVESQHGSGATFHFTLPLRRAQTHVSAPESEGAQRAAAQTPAGELAARSIVRSARST
ncbi:MAG TPA: ATP-binding protein, partial [Thermoanaerobaculia bacterium]|nr:ATP-binding protein [Thermoanaerobaculia bacterium]